MSKKNHQDLWFLATDHKKEAQNYQDISKSWEKPVKCQKDEKKNKNRLKIKYCWELNENSVDFRQLQEKNSTITLKTELEMSKKLTQNCVTRPTKYLSFSSPKHWDYSSTKKWEISTPESRPWVLQKVFKKSLTSIKVHKPMKLCHFQFSLKHDFFRHHPKRWPTKIFQFSTSCWQTAKLTTKSKTRNNAWSWQKIKSQVSVFFLLHIFL